MPVHVIRTRGLAAIVISLGTLAASLVITHGARGIDNTGNPRASIVVPSSSVPSATPREPAGTGAVSVRWGGNTPPHSLAAVASRQRRTPAVDRREPRAPATEQLIRGFVRVLICPDKFRGTASAQEAAAALAAGARDAGWDPIVLPLADGGEGTLDALGGPTTSTTVTGPLGAPVDAPWRLSRDHAVVEMALASGLILAGGAVGNDPLAATSRGTGELIVAAIEAGARSIVVGVGGSACTDGGLGAVEALAAYGPLDGTRGYRVVVACDVRTRFVDAARVFAPQKGATPEDLVVLSRRLELLADEYELSGVEVRTLPGSGAAGGLAGGLAALGAALVPGFGVVADALHLRELMGTADHVITGEGRLDAQSFDGKVVGGVLALARELEVPCTVIAGDIADQLPAAVVAVSLLTLFGADSAHMATRACLRTTAAQVLVAVRPRSAHD